MSFRFFREAFALWRAGANNTLCHALRYQYFDFGSEFLKVYYSRYTNYNITLCSNAAKF